MQRIDNIETPWKIFIETTGYDSREIDPESQWVMPINTTLKQKRQITKILMSYMRKRNMDFREITRQVLYFNDSGIDLDGKEFAKEIYLSEGLLRDKDDETRVNANISAANAYRSALLSGTGISESIFGNTPDTICTQNEKLFLHLLSSLTKDQVKEVKTMFFSRKNEILADYVLELPKENEEKKIFKKQLKINRFCRLYDKEKHLKRRRTVLAYMFDDEFIIYIRRINQLRIKNLSFQSHIPLKSPESVENQFMMDIQSGKSDMSGAIGFFLTLSFRTLVGVDDMLSFIPWFAKGRYVYCDFAHREYFALSRTEKQWVSLFQGVHPETQSEIIARCIDKYNIKRLNPVVKLP